LKRIKINLVALKEVMQEEDSKGNAGNEGIPATVEEDRRHLVEAAVVRIMKARKRSDHNDLIAEVTKQISSRFNPAPQVCVHVFSKFVASILIISSTNLTSRSLSKRELRA
jgi:cullin 3